MTHVSTLRLHQLRLGELEGDEEIRLRTHLADCDVCARRLDAQLETRHAFVRQPPPPFLAPSPSLWDRLGLGRWFVLALPALAVAVVAVRALPGDDAAADLPAEDVREKGGIPLLEAWIESGRSARPVYTGERVRPGTRVQLKFDPGRHRFVTLAGRDGEGTVEVYGTLPAQGPGMKTAPFALTLDDTPGDQEFFAVLTDTRPAPEEVIGVLEAEPIRLSRGEIASLVLRKE